MISNDYILFISRQIYISIKISNGILISFELFEIEITKKNSCNGSVCLYEIVTFYDNLKKKVTRFKTHLEHLKCYCVSKWSSIGSRCKNKKRL